jgi:hypothetical protein
MRLTGRSAHCFDAGRIAKRGTDSLSFTCDRRLTSTGATNYPAAPIAGGKSERSGYGIRANGPGAECGSCNVALVISFRGATSRVPRDHIQAQGTQWCFSYLNQNHVQPSTPVPEGAL